MENTLLENGRFLVEIGEKGAELTRFYDKVKKREIIWEGDPKIWGRHAPVLFPFVGKCFNGKYQYEGKSYEMTAHGFARDSTFKLSSNDETQCWYCLRDTEETYSRYPFHFHLEIGYRLFGNRLQVLWRVKNTDTKVMYFMIGGHPAFRTPPGKTVYDFSLDFIGKDFLHYQSPNAEGYVEKTREGTLALDDGRALVTEGFFKEALTYIFDEGQVKAASLLVNGEPYVTVRCLGFPYMGVWTVEETHPFICLEPWFGRCDREGYCGELREKEGILALDPEKVFDAGYLIEIH